MEFGIDRIIADLENKANDIIELEKKETKLKAELEYYSTLNSITQDQSETIIKLLRQNKLLDYVIGFIIGLTAS